MGGSREEEGWSSKLGFGKGYGFEEMDVFGGVGMDQVCYLVPHGVTCHVP